jgi:large subunit ribosomal protein L1
VSFSADALYENLAALMTAIRKARPSGAKGLFIRKVTIASTMGPGVKIDPNTAIAMEADKL